MENNSVSIFDLFKKVGKGLKFAFDFDLLFSNHWLNLNVKEYFY